MIGVLAIAALIAALGFFSVVRLRTLLTYFQQEEYDGSRFLGAVARVRLYDVRASVVLAAVAALQFVLPRGEAALAATLFVGAGLIAAIAWAERGYAYKKPLAMTERARRIVNVAGAFAAVLVIGGALLGPLPALVAVQLLPLTLIVANWILAPMQARVNEGFVSEARAKLARMNPKRIGITGSFGKTTTKHIFAEILSVSGPVFYSKGSINTVLGLTRHIRERLQWSHRYFIAEMGAYGIGSIDRLCRFVHPDYGIVTAIGDAHTERFGSVENIAQAKSELVEHVCDANGVAVVATQVMAYAPFRKLRAQFPEQVVTVGPEEDADIRIVTASLQDAAWQITLADRRADRSFGKIAYELPLLGEHNVMNSALAVAMAAIIDPAIAGRIPLVTPDVEQVPHRLQKRESPGQALVLDDAYNANEKGFRNALSVAAELARERGGRAILVTPGVAELGIEHDRVHAALGAEAADKADLVYVVNPGRIPTFVTALTEAGKPPNEVASFADARKALDTEAQESDVLLYANDLPDLLEETRLL